MTNIKYNDPNDEFTLTAHCQLGTVFELSDDIAEFFEKVEKNRTDGSEVVDYSLTDLEKLAHKKTIDKIYNKLIRLLKNYINLASDRIVGTSRIVKQLLFGTRCGHPNESVWSLDECLHNYCNFIKNGRDSGIEKVLLAGLSKTVPNWQCAVTQSLTYHLNVICFKTPNRWNEFEEILINYNFDVFYQYCTNLESRIESFEKKFQEKEKFEPRDLEFIIRYIEKHNINSWPEIEKHFLVNGKICLDYMEVTNKTTRWAEAEPAILKSGLTNCEIYLSKLNEFFRWKEYENKIKNRPNRLVDYAKKIIKGRLPEELHNRMLMRSIKGDCYNVTYYFDWLKNRELEIVSYLKSITETERQEIISKV